MESLSKAFTVYSKIPFLFAWGSLMYIVLFLAFLFASIGVLIAYFVTLPIIGEEVNLQSTSSLAIFGIVGILFVFFIGGLNAALAKAYRSAFWKERTSLTGFFSYALDMAPEMFGIQLIRELVWLMLAGPAIAIYIYFLADYVYMDLLVGTYVLFATFVIHMFFTPAFLYAGAMGTNLFSSLKHMVELLRKKHIYFIAVFTLFSIAWVLNFVPIVQLLSIFMLFPVTYTSMILMAEGSHKMEGD